MASSYWESTQRKFWTFTKSQLALERKRIEDSERNLVNAYPLPDRRHLSIYFCHQLCKMAKALNFRQQAIATAQVYMRRFYLKTEIRRTHPLLVLSTSLYLAAKMEETPQHIKYVSAEARHALDLAFYDISKMGECEFTLISELNSQLIIHHPYRSLAELESSFQLTQEENSLAWNIINDHYLTDLPLLHPPHVIAITAMFLAVVLKPTQNGLQMHSAKISSALQTLGSARGSPGGQQQQQQAQQAQQQQQMESQMRVQKLVDFLAESTVDMEAVVDCTQELISLYEVWESYNDKVCKDQIMKFVRARGLDK